jgi:tetratricopeptide (TPR) repeat protein
MQVYAGVPTKLFRGHFCLFNYLLNSIVGAVLHKPTWKTNEGVKYLIITFMSAIGYIILGFSILFTLVWSLRVREKARSEQATEKGMELQGFLMTVSIVLVIVLHLSPFHLLWMLPASFILGLLSMTTPLRILWIFSSIYFLLWYIGIRNEGRRLYVSGEYDKAIDAFKEEIRKKPTSAEAYFNLGLAYGKTGELEKEVAAYEQAIKLKPNVSATYFNLGTAYNIIGNKKKAIAAFNDAIRLDSDYVKARYTVCKIYVEVGDRENANKEYRILQERDKRISEELEQLINSM